MNESCGVFGCILATDSSSFEVDIGHTMCTGLISLQHRGNESSGVVGSKNCWADQSQEHFEIVKGKGLVRDVFNAENLKQFKDCVVCIGHNRYSTAGIKDAINCVQPFVVHTVSGLVAVAHNGELVDAEAKRKQILRRGVGLSTDTDSELIAQIIAHASATKTKSKREDSCLEDELRCMMNELTLSYSLLVMSRDRIYAVRDPWGNRPLCIGVVEDPEHSLNGYESRRLAYLASSETCAFCPNKAKFLQEVQPGEVVEITQRGVRTCFRSPRPNGASMALCIFEYVYFARPDSEIEGLHWIAGQQVSTVRARCGRQLGIEAKVEADIVSTVPDSATPAALGYAQETRIPYEQVLYKNSYVGRSFIQPNTKLRQQAIAKKFGALQENFCGKRVVLVDDSIVRGNTVRPIVKLLKNYGATEVHIRIASPPIRFRCNMGINIPSEEELLAHKVDTEQLAEYLGADSVVYLSVEGLLKAVRGGIDQRSETGHCTACLTGKYPVEKLPHF